MADIGELDDLNDADEADDDKCPFCYEAPHAFASRKRAPTTVVHSVPRTLACVMLPVTGVWRHTTAKHHLISAMQCYARVRRLVRMASSIGYDVNQPPNGIGLPTVANNIAYPVDLTYPVGALGTQKFGLFDDDDKEVIAFAVMEQAGAQWHVGHHAFNVDIPDDWADESDDNFAGHEVSYDERVIELLMDLADSWIDKCEDAADQSGNLKLDVDQVSEYIRDHLNMFAGDEPWHSSPFFVSRQAFEFASRKYDERPDSDDEDDEDDDPPAGHVKKKAKVG